MRRVMVFGTFDLLHEGHRFVLGKAGERGEVTVVVARSENVQRIKGRKPNQGDDERMAKISEAFPAYRVILGDTRNFIVPVHVYAPDLILLGYDQKFPPGITDADLAPALIERLPAYRENVFKTSLMRPKKV